MNFQTASFPKILIVWKCDFQLLVGDKASEELELETHETSSTILSSRVVSSKFIEDEELLRVGLAWARIVLESTDWLGLLYSLILVYFFISASITL